ncbi:MAG: gliding motility-associated-like protein [Crocinitomix sp.]|jgi:gliding motility-associated-like protein
MKIFSFLVLQCLIAGSLFSQITDPTPYCVFNAWGAAPIDNVQIGALDHDPAYDWGTTMYNYYNEEVVPDIMIGVATPMSITFGDAIDGEPQLFGVYIDFNHDNIFTEDEDLMNNWDTGGGYLPCFAGTDETRVGNVTVPLIAEPGITRMRVVRSHIIPFDWGAPPPGPGDHAAPCNAGVTMDDTEYSYGEAVDYDVNLIADGPIELTALFTPETSTICNDEELIFTDASLSEDGVTAWNWTFEGGFPALAATVGPHTVLYDTPGVYNVILEVTDATGMHDTTFAITVEDCTTPLTALFTPENTVVCVDDIITFTDASLSEDGITDWSWSFEGGLPLAALTEGPHDVAFNIAGVYDITLEVEDATGVHDTTFTITVLEDCDAIEAIFTPSSLDICQGDCLNFEDESIGIGIIEYAWTFSDPAIGGPILGEESGLVCFDNPGEQLVTLTVTNGAFVDDMTIAINVRVLPEITVDVDPGTEICEGDEVSLLATGALTYLWTSGVENGVPFIPIVTETFVVLGEDEFGCFGEADITVNVITCTPVLAEFESLEEICVGNCISFIDRSTGSPTAWDWAFDDLDISEEQNPIYCFEIAGEFNITLTVSNDEGDESIYNKVITVFEGPTVNAASDTIIDIGGSANLLAIGSDLNGSYVWSPDNRVECEDCQLTIAKPIENQTYIVTHTSTDGCFSTDTVNVLVNFLEGVGVASAFSPNNNGNNDVLFVQGFGIRQMYFAVYNRYGELVFETTEQNIGWDGTFMNKDQNSGVFHWLLQYELVDGNKGAKKGNTTLIR